MLPGHRIFQRCAGMSCRSRVSLGSRKNCSQSIQTLHIPHRQHLPGSAGFQLKRVWVRVNLKNSSQKLVVGRGQRTVLLPTSVWEKNAWQWLIVPAACPILQELGQNLGVLRYESDIQEVNAKSTMLTSSYFTWELSPALEFLRSKGQAWVLLSGLCKAPPANLSAKMRSPGPSQPKFFIFGTLSKFVAI